VQEDGEEEEEDAEFAAMKSKFSQMINQNPSLANQQINALNGGAPGGAPMFPQQQ
jgi:hypothetical protein